jgi:hypothetical protein
MSEHTNKILEHIKSSLELYEKGKLNEEQLELNLTGNINAIEEQDIRNQLNDFIPKIEESLFLYDTEQGRQFLLQEIKKLKNKLFIQQNRKPIIKN